MKIDWSDNVMLHGWPENGPGSLQLEDLYQAFKTRMELEANHTEACALRTGEWDECTCKPNQPEGESR